MYLTTESPTNDGYGGHRPGNNLFSDSLVCLDIKTGKMIWYKQLIHHDIWDYDMPVASDPARRQCRRPADQGRRADGEDGVWRTCSTAPTANRCGRFPMSPVHADRRADGMDVADAADSHRSRRPFDVVGVTTDDLINFTPALRAGGAPGARRDTGSGAPFAPPRWSSRT